MQPITTVLFDISGIFTPDQYETILSHEEHGLARHLSLDEITSRVRHIWDKYAVLPDGKERDFWNELGEVLGVPLNRTEIAAVRTRLITANPTGRAALQYLKDKGVRIGLISNCTGFFYDYQNELVHLEDFANKDLIFLSHMQKMTKSNGLFELAAKHVDPAHTLVLDDRPKNVARAQRIGFQAAYYSMFESGSLLDFVKKIVG